MSNCPQCGAEMEQFGICGKCGATKSPLKTTQNSPIKNRPSKLTSSVLRKIIVGMIGFIVGGLLARGIAFFFLIDHLSNPGIVALYKVITLSGAAVSSFCCVYLMVKDDQYWNE